MKRFNASAPCIRRCQTDIMTTRFQEYCDRQRAKYGDRFTAPTDARLIYAYNQGHEYRIKVRTTYPSGETHERWGFVGITTGWAPAFLLMHSTRAYGSSDVLSDHDEIIGWHWRKSA